MRTRVAATIGAAAETLDSVKLPRAPGAGLSFRRRQVSVRGRLDERVRPLTALLPPPGPEADVWGLAGDPTCVEEAVDRPLGAPRELLRVEFEHIRFRPEHRSWARGPVDGDRTTWLQVTAASRACHGVAVAPHGDGVRVRPTRSGRSGTRPPVPVSTTVGGTACASRAGTEPGPARPGRGPSDGGRRTTPRPGRGVRRG
ncbi:MULTISPECIES: hypothetical protein [unclassified Streptomyces]|uniref:hypothetical protein n=1 Tax=unclassified Streptomyces TaxID=2593676 RepID=UPI0033BDB587